MASSALTDGRIVARPHDPDDLESLFTAVKESLAQLIPWLPWCHPGYSLTDAANFIEFSREGWADQSEFHFVVADARTGQLLGGVGLSHIDRTNRMANMGYWTRSNATHRNVATAAARLAARFGFTEVGLTRIEVAVMPANAASRRVAEKLGAKLESIARNRLVMHGEAYDAALFSLVPGDLDVY